MGPNKKDLKILYWNARSILKRKEEIQQILHTVDIFACVETWLSPSVVNLQYPGFVSFRLDRTHAPGGGILLLIRKNLTYKEIPGITCPYESVEICGIRITNTNPAFNLIVCYRAPGLTLTLDQWDTIFSNIKVDQCNILMGDFNAHHVNWKCNRSDKNGENLLEMIEKY